MDGGFLVPSQHPLLKMGTIKHVRGARLSNYSHNEHIDHKFYGFDELGPELGRYNLNLAKGCHDPFVLEVYAEHPVQYRLVRCRKCPVCMKMRQAEWAHRASLEYYAGTRTWWITLTYRGSREPTYEDVKLFKKRLLKNTDKFRFVCSAERGDEGNRLHWHMLLHCQASPIKRREIERAWGKGFVHARLARTNGLGAYLAKYLAKTAGSDITASLRYGRDATLYRAVREDVATHIELFERTGVCGIDKHLRLTKTGVRISRYGLTQFNRHNGAAVVPYLPDDIPF